MIKGEPKIRYNLIIQRSSRPVMSSPDEEFKFKESKSIMYTSLAFLHDELNHLYEELVSVCTRITLDNGTKGFRYVLDGEVWQDLIIIERHIIDEVELWQ